MKFLTTLMLTMFFAFGAYAQNVEVFNRDVKFPRQNVLEYQSFGAPAASSNLYIKSGFAGNTTTTAVTLSSFIAQPDMARNLVVTPGGTTADVAACTITVSGTDYKSRSISEDFTFTANQATSVVGLKAFKSVSSVLFPANCEDSPYTASWSIGIGEKIGLRQCMADAGDWIYSSINGTYESTRATVTANTSVLSLNTADFNGTMNGSSTFKARFIQSYGCY